MRLHVLSDLHLEFGPWSCPEVAADVVVLAGDVHTGTRGVAWAARAFAGRPVVHVAGNHEFYGQALPRHLDKLREAAAGTDVVFLEDEAVAIGGVRFVGCTLWTDMALRGEPHAAALDAELMMNDYRRIRVDPRYRRLRAVDTVARHHASRRWLAAALAEPFAGPTVVVTHHAPGARSIPARFDGHPANPAYASDLEALVCDSGAALWVHGHIHHPCDWRAGATRVLCNPRGYPDQPSPAFDPELVVEV
jgi:predicted phosphodiesterase